MILTYIVSFSEMQQKVKEETSHIAVREVDKDGNSLFESFVFDEGYETLFRDYFFGAIGEISEKLAAYTKELPVESLLIETSRAGGEDFIAQLIMPDNFNHVFAKPVGVNIEAFFKAYIVYRWLEDKLPEKAEPYGVRYDDLGSRINADLNKRSNGIRRGNRYW